MWRCSLALVAAACGAHPTPRRLDYEGHRGARGLRPENTLGAFDRAIALGVDTLEMDVMLTSDDILVVHHDEHLNPDITRDASGAWLAATGPAIRSLSFEALEQYDVGRIRPGSAYAARFPDQQGSDGVRIPMLRQVIALAEQRAGGRIHYNIEIKTTPARPTDTAPPAHVAEVLVGIVRELGIADRTTIQSFDWRGLRRVAALAPVLPRSCLTEAPLGDATWTDGMALSDHGGSVPKLVAAFGCQIWSPDYATLTGAEVSEAHGLGLRVLPWTVDTPAAIANVIGLGVDGLITDFPDRLPPR